MALFVANRCSTGCPRRSCRGRGSGDESPSRLVPSALVRVAPDVGLVSTTGNGSATAIAPVLVGVSVSVSEGPPMSGLRLGPELGTRSGLVMAATTVRSWENSDVLPAASVAVALTTWPGATALGVVKANDPLPLASVRTEANPRNV